MIEELLSARTWSGELAPLEAQLRGGVAQLTEAVAFVKGQAGSAYRDLYARKLVDLAIDLMVGALFCDHATASTKKLAVAKHWLNSRLPQVRMLKEQICSGDASTLTDFESLAGALPVAD